MIVDLALKAVFYNV